MVSHKEARKLKQAQRRAKTAGRAAGHEVDKQDVPVLTSENCDQGSINATAADAPISLSYTLRGYEDGKPFERDLHALDRWATQAADSISVTISTTTNQDALPPLTVHLKQRASVFIGGQLWNTAFILACWFYARHAHGIHDYGALRVCEVGAGIGLLALALAALDARVTATDLADVVPILDDNIARNPHLAIGAGGVPRITAAALDWGDKDAVVPGYPFDLIVACDCIYSEVSAGDLVECLVRQCSPVTPGGPRPATIVWVVSEVRNESIQQAFLEQAREVFEIGYMDVDRDVSPYLPRELRTGLNVRWYVMKLKPGKDE
ncbi:hypothetical protein AMAG_00574 [Allomyces macrogynus ATCC 38327]|uniref:Uncharacterized protein n=1 Tax=Allomyces macrogynus (strain ATCC 38327) TaxID=578462 RepID=A0A0L0RWX0_ALLM3|nr:hypothetical protein AMAG_00574 [Allomyces macrogynus ATCC 38327]|eukprot:KNE54609.1 hypothetical protein AMAG_00574 [Allomyces macrogynus ATCC 38327]